MSLESHFLKQNGTPSQYVLCEHGTMDNAQVESIEVATEDLGLLLMALEGESIVHIDGVGRS